MFKIGIMVSQKVDVIHQEIRTGNLFTYNENFIYLSYIGLFRFSISSPLNFYTCVFWEYFDQFMSI